MTLKVTSSQIQMKNSSGVTKFTSTDKLVYLKWQKTKLMLVSNAAVYEPFYALGSSEFLVLTITPYYSSGAVMTSLLAAQIPANGSIMIDFTITRDGNTAYTTNEYLGCALIGSSLVFKPIRFDYQNIVQTPIHSTGFTVNAKIYSYL